MDTEDEYFKKYLEEERTTNRAYLKDDWISAKSVRDEGIIPAGIDITQVPPIQILRSGVIQVRWKKVTNSPAVRTWNKA